MCAVWCSVGVAIENQFVPGIFTIIVRARVSAGWLQIRGQQVSYLHLQGATRGKLYRVAPENVNVKVTEEHDAHLEGAPDYSELFFRNICNR